MLFALFLGCCNDFTEYFWVLFSNLGKNLAVYSNVRNLEHVDETGVGKAEFVNCSVDLYRPKGTECALLGTAIAEGVHTSFEHGRAGKTNLALSAPLEAFYSGKKIFTSLRVLCTALNSRHINWKKTSLVFLGEIVWHHRFKSATDGNAEGDIGTLIACGVARFA